MEGKKSIRNILNDEITFRYQVSVDADWVRNYYEPGTDRDVPPTEVKIFRGEGTDGEWYFYPDDGGFLPPDGFKSPEEVEEL